PASLTLTRRLLNGAPAAGEGRYSVRRLEQPARPQMPADLPAPPAPEGAVTVTAGDLQRARWETLFEFREVLASWPEAEEVASGRVRHGEDGVAALELDLPAGVFRVLYETEDAFGTGIERSLDLIVAGSGERSELRLPAFLAAESETVKPGETARFLVHSGFSGQALFFDVFHRDERLERRMIRAMDAPQILEVPIGPEQRGGIAVRLTVLRDHQLLQLQESVDVPWVDRQLEVAFERFRDRLMPGEQETFTLTVRGSGDDLAAQLDPRTVELVAYMFDRSLDLFAKHQPPRPISLYPRGSWAPSLSSSLGSAPTLMHRHLLPSPPSYPNLRPARLIFLDGWPIGGPGRRGGAGVRMLTARAAPSAALGKAAPAPPSPPARASVIEQSASVTMDNAFDASAEAEAAGSPDEPQEGPADPDGRGEFVRSDFAETAFFLPHLRLGADGSTRVEFTVPDSVTEWSVWAHALTRDLRSGSAEERTRSAKDLLIRPYLPRFVREGDRAELRLLVSNSGAKKLVGEARVRVEHPETGEDLSAAFGLSREQLVLPFEALPGASTTLALPLEAPRNPQPVAITAVARSGSLSDGERRPLPVLPSRLHLAQSRFAAVRGPGVRTLRFEELEALEDETLESESLIVTLDGQLFGSVLRAVPYLVDDPYQCTEQNLNRYLATGILSRLYDDYPGVARLAARLAAERDTPLEEWNDPDPNRRLLLEETPWLRHARGGEDVEGLLKVLDPEIAERVRAEALAEVLKAQTSSGGFPWWPGGPPSPYLTLYTLQGFSRALDFGLEVPKEPVQRAWRYLASYWRDELSREIAERKCCAPRLTFLAWLLSAYPDDSWTGGAFSDDDRRRILDLAARDWRTLSPRLKGYLALALARSDRRAEAVNVWESVMDSAKTAPDLGTFWAPEDRAWLWYNDTVETHAFALRVLLEIDPEDERRHGLAQWLMLNKKLSHWKSTRATAEALYALAAYLEAEGGLGVRETVIVQAGPRRERYELDPDKSGRRQLVVPGESVLPAMGEIDVEVSSESLLFASATWHFATDRLPEEASGDFFRVERRYFRRVLEKGAYELRPLAEGEPIAVGDQVEVHLSLRSKHAAEYVHLRDPRGAGFEPEDTRSGWSFSDGLGSYREIRDSGTHFFFEWLPVGEYIFRYRLRATTSGSFRVGPAQLQSMYAPEFVAYSSGRVLEIEP
ncbi:MAG: alpha-2-macroglobulin family protein, partial [Acidobacteriota bacterium]